MEQKKILDPGSKERRKDRRDPEEGGQDPREEKRTEGAKGKDKSGEPVPPLDGTKIKRNCHRPGGCNHPCNRVPSLLPSTIYFSSRPRFTATIICFYVRSWKSFRLSRTSPLLSSSPLSPCPARFPLAETSRVLFLPSPREKFKRGGNLRDSLFLPPPPPPSSRGIRGERRKADRKFRSLWIKVFSKLPCPPLPIPRHPYLALSVQVASAGLRGNGRGGTLDDVFYICRGVELIGERGSGASFREWNSVPRLQDQPGEISGINSGLDIDFVKMPDRHHLRTDGEFTGGDAWMIY